MFYSGVYSPLKALFHLHLPGRWPTAERNKAACQGLQATTVISERDLAFQCWASAYVQGTSRVAVRPEPAVTMDTLGRVLPGRG